MAMIHIPVPIPAKKWTCKHPKDRNVNRFSAQEQSWKKIIDLDLKDRDHLIDLDLFHDLDPY